MLSTCWKFETVPQLSRAPNGLLSFNFLGRALSFEVTKIRISHHGDDHSGHRGNSPCWPGWTARFDMDDQAPVGLAIQQLWKLKVAKGRLIVDVCVPADQRSVFAERTAVT